MWLFGGRAPPSFSHSILVSTPPAAEQVNSTALPWAFTSTCGATRTANGATKRKEECGLGYITVTAPLLKIFTRRIMSGIYFRLLA